MESDKGKKKISPEAMKIRMADLCSRSEQCEFDLKMKMYRAGLSSTEISKIIEFLKRERFLDESRYAVAFARDKVRFSGWGKYKVRLHLLAKRVSSENIKRGLESVEEKDYLEALARVALSKVRGLNMQDNEDCRKLYRYLLTRGFESDLAKGEVLKLRKQI